MKKSLSVYLIKLISTTLIFTSLPLTGCTWESVFGLRGAKKTRAIEFWHSMTGDKSQVLRTIVADYNKLARESGSFPVKLQFVGSYADGINKLRLAVMAGRPPHLAQIYEIGTRQLVDSGAVIPVEDLIGDDDGFGLSQMLPQVLDYYRVHGKLYSLPFATSNPVIYANGDILRKTNNGVVVPTTFEEIKSICPRLVAGDSALTCLTMPLTSWLFEQAIAQQGAYLLDQENGRMAPANRSVYAGEQGRYFLEFLKSLASDGMFANTGRAWDPPVENFMAGRSVFLLTSTSDVFVLDKKAKFEVVVAPFPKRALETIAEPEDSMGGTVIGGNAIWAMKGHQASEMSQAAKFLKYLASVEVQTKWHVNTGYFPIRGDVVDQLDKSGFYQKHPNARVAIDQLLAAPLSIAARGALSGVFPEMREHIENAMEEVISGRAHSDRALSHAAKKTDKALMRYKKLL